MILKFQRSMSMTAVDFVKCILPLLGNIVQFEIFKDKKESPYTAIESGVKKYYSFILTDDKGNELWLDTSCGYGGSSPLETDSILQILGLRDNYGVTNEGNNHLLHKALTSDYTLNLLIFDQNNKELLLATMNFRYAYQRWATIDSLNCFGYIRGITKEDSCKEIFPISHSEHDFSDYATNIKLHLDKEYTVPDYNGFKLVHIKTMVKSIVNKNLGKVVFFRVIGMSKENQEMERFKVTITSQIDTDNLVVFANSHREAIKRIKEEEPKRLCPDALVVVDGAKSSKRYRISSNLNAVELAEYNY